jgi:adenosine deaminase
MNAVEPSGTAHDFLLCTLGASWAVVPEVFGWLAPDLLDLYAAHPDRLRLDALRSEHGLRRPDELWVCTTDGERAMESIAMLRRWWQRLGEPLPLRIWTAAGTDQLASATECAHLRELTFRLVLLAASRAGAGGQVVLSLAGGRKTMSADLQDAGGVFGVAAWLHVVGPEPLPQALRGAEVDAFTRPLPPALATAVTPLLVGRGCRSELLDVDDGAGRIDTLRFPLPVPGPADTLRWAAPATDQTPLHAEVARRLREGQRWLGNFVAQLASEDAYDAWPTLLRLPASTIQRLRRQRVDASQRELLRRLPKSDLHRHLGGCLDLRQQQEVAEVVWEGLSPAARDAAVAVVRPLLQADALWPWEWPRSLHGDLRCAASAALLLHATPRRLHEELFARTEPRVALKRRSPHGFAAYERPGELSGSALLAHPAAIGPYAKALVAQAREEGLLYIELRGSPHKYRPGEPLGFVRELEAALGDAGAQTRGFDPQRAGPRIGLVWIVDRRQRDRTADVVAHAVRAHDACAGFVLGLDLAGDEGTIAPEQLAADFTPAFASCMPVTIHAGEGEAAENIWQAAYHLHADRIGHGLTIADHPPLAQRFRDRGIALELCPTSNREVVGFRDPDCPASLDCPPYPLRVFIHAGLPVTLCTDNPGISRTTLADEFVAASRMTRDGLTLWEALAIGRQGIVHAFVPAAERQLLLRTAERRLFEILSAESTLASASA